MKKSNKAFDCIAFKRMVQAAIHEETKNLAGPELVEYFRNKVEGSPFSDYFHTARGEPKLKPSPSIPAS